MQGGHVRWWCSGAPAIEVTAQRMCAYFTLSSACCDTLECCAIASCVDILGGYDPSLP